jgi:hypothetical protein
VADPATPSSEAAAHADEEGIQALTSEVAGLVVVTQTCDIVRTCTTRPHVEVALLMQSARTTSAIDGGQQLVAR